MTDTPPSNAQGSREGSLDAPTRHPLDWKNPAFTDEKSLFDELERVFDICHGCRRCFSLCNAFPTLFDGVDEQSETMEVDALPRKVYWEVVDHCYLCDMCYMSKCPYVPPHPFQVDFPHLMLRAKHKKFADGKVGMRDRVLASTDRVGRLAGIPVVAQVVNAANRNKLARKALSGTLGVHADAPIPEYHARPARKRLAERLHTSGEGAREAGPTRGRVVLFTTCYGNRNQPQMVEDLVAVFEHNDIPVRLAATEQCCGMPKLELGDLEAVEQAKNVNVPELERLVDEGWDIVAPVPSCVLMFKQELPLLFPDDEQVKKVAAAMFDPFHYLQLRSREGLMNTGFSQSLGKVSYQVPCHLRVQNIGMKTRDVLNMVPDTTVEPIERCSGHDGTYAVKNEFHEVSRKIARPVVRRAEDAGADHFASDCPMAADQIANISDKLEATHPLSLLRKAYGI